MLSLPETNVAPENGWLEYDCFLSGRGMAYFQGRAVRFREGQVPAFEGQVPAFEGQVPAFFCWRNIKVGEIFLGHHFLAPQIVITREFAQNARKVQVEKNSL